MYRPSAFVVEDQQALESLIREVSLGILSMTAAKDPMTATLPFALRRGEAGGPPTLQGHLARANPMVALCEPGARASVTFLGPQAYVSPRWYRSPQPAVPTWNYIAVEVTGSIGRRLGPADTLGVLDTLTREHEQRVGSDWTPAELGAGPLLSRLLDAIVAFEVVIERIEGKWKLGQNRPAQERASVVAALERLDEPGGRTLAAEMRRELAADHARTGVMAGGLPDRALTISMADRDEEVAECFEVMRGLREHLASPQELAARVADQSRRGNYRIIRARRAGRVVGCAGFRRLDTLFAGRMIYVDDLATLEGERSQGVGRALLQALVGLARSEGRTSIHLDSGVQRHAAHRFYLREGFEIRSHHFVLPLD